jgi:hypothetical protein
MGFRDPVGGPGPPAVLAERPLLRDMWCHRTCPRAGSGSETAGEMESDPRVPAAQPLMA